MKAQTFRGVNQLSDEEIPLAELASDAGFVPSGGGFAEYVKGPGHIVRNGGLIPIPAHVTFEQASFVEPTNCCLKAIKRREENLGKPW